MTAFAYGTTVTLISRTVSGTDSYGNDTFTETAEDVTAPVWPRSSTETVQGEDQVITGLAALLPAGTVLAAIDAVAVNGDRYEVDGEPGRYTSPFTNLDPGVLVNLKRVTG